MLVLVEIPLLLLLSAEMELSRFLKLFTSSCASPLTLVFVGLCVSSLMSLISVGCVLSPTVSVILLSSSASLGCPFETATGG